MLSGTLSTELIRTIRNKLPSLTANIQGNITTLNQELSALGEDIPEGRGAMVHAIIELCNKVQEEYKQIINHVRPGFPAVFWSRDREKAHPVPATSSAPIVVAAVTLAPACSTVQCERCLRQRGRNVALVRAGKGWR